MRANRRHGIHGSYTDVIILNPTKPLTGGGSNNLADGQIALTYDKPTPHGLKVQNTETGIAGASNAMFQHDKSWRKYYIEVGTGVNASTQEMTTKNIRTAGFRPEDILQVTYSSSKAPVQSEVILGYDGFDSSKSITLKPSQAATVSLKLEGEALAFYGRKNGTFEGTFSMQMPETEDCNDNCLDGACVDMVNTVIDEILTYQLVEGIPLSTFIDAYPVTDCFEECYFEETGLNIYRISLCDSGDDQALGMVRAQTAGIGENNVFEFDVYRESYDAVTATSVYATAPVNKPPNKYIKYGRYVTAVCDTCPEGSELLWSGDGWFYNFSARLAELDAPNQIAEAGALLELVVAYVDKIFLNVAVEASDIVQDLRSIDAWVLNDDGRVKLWFVTDRKLTDAEFEELISNINNNTTEWEEVEKVENVCVGEDSDTPWTLEKACVRANAHAFIQLSDTICGNSRLTELQENYDDSVISNIIELVGGEAIGYSAGVNVDEADGYYINVNVVGGSGSSAEVDITITGTSAKICASGNLGSGYVVGDSVTAVIGEGTPITFTVTEVAPAPDNCRRMYSGQLTAQKCGTDCYDQKYEWTLPDMFEFEEWYIQTSKNTDTTCLCGIAFVGKDLELCPPREIADQIGVINSQLKIQVSGGELLGTKIGYPYNLKPFPVTHVRRAFDGTGWGEDYMDAEKATYDRYLSYLAGDTYAERWFKNITTKLQPCVQYDTITVKLRSSESAQSFTQRVSETFRYIFVVPKGSAYLYANFFRFLASGNDKADVVSIPTLASVAPL